VDPSANAASLAEQTKKDDISAAYKAMSDEINDRMYEVFCTLKADHATAEYNTWKDMLDHPAAYASVGLKVNHQINNPDGSELFSPGSALDTVQKILDFAKRKIQLAHEYGVFRKQRLQQFYDQREKIRNRNG
jgi:hypothetical protein